MYKFVRIHKKSDQSDYGCWFLEPSSIEQINEHFDKVCGFEIRKGVDEICKKADVNDDGVLKWSGHIITPFAYSVFADMDANAATNAVNLNFLQSCINVENAAYQTRVKSFLDGQTIYLAESMTVFMLDERFFEIVETIEKYLLVYPHKEKYTLGDVRYMQWNMFGNKGTHWYAKVGKRDIVDKEGRMKWDTKSEAECAAKWFIDNQLK